MDLGKYGPFANIVALAGALVAVFGALLFKILGGVKRWAWLASDTPPFLVAAAARIAAVALMAAAYIFVDASNYPWFALVAVVTGILGFLGVGRFDKLRRRHILSVPLVAADGNQLHDKHGRPRSYNVVIGTEDRLRPEAAEALKVARQKQGISIGQFMSGYGKPVNDPAALWDNGYLADTAGGIATALMHVVLLAVITVFMAALVLDIATNKGTPHAASTGAEAGRLTSDP